MKRGVIIAAIFVLFAVGVWPADQASAETFITGLRNLCEAG